MKNVVVYFNGNGLLISSVIAKRFALKPGGIIKTEDEFWEVVRANAAYQLLALSAIVNSSKN